ncbi:hypothetical protein VFPFJ_08878 [Purpureocillium lilacinum]|nr:hypothetical protein VFPFJ_08878 [Purpureocillium lilacinum]OAQ83075.1 hypothetical protein VFPFJ_08878 [Purpureocillium lilacinum]
MQVLMLLLVTPPSCNQLNTRVARPLEARLARAQRVSCPDPLPCAFLASSNSVATTPHQTLPNPSPFLPPFDNVRAQSYSDRHLPAPALSSPCVLFRLHHH